MTTTSQSTLCEVEDMKRTEAEQLFHKNIKLAHHVLHRNYPTFSQNEDIQQEALLGLWRACLTYDKNKGNFSTYAGQCILNQIRYAMRSFAKQPETVSLSHPVGEDGATLEDFIEDPCPGTDEGLVDLKLFLEGLTQRELKLIQLSAAGLTQEEIGKQLGRSRAWCCITLRRLQENYLKQEDQE